MVASDGWVGADPAQPGLGYLRIAEGLRELHWSAGSVSGGRCRACTTSAACGLVASGGRRAVAVLQRRHRRCWRGQRLARASAAFRGSRRRWSTPAATWPPSSSAPSPPPRCATRSRRCASPTAAHAGGAAASNDLRLLAASDQGLVIAGTPSRAQAVVAGQRRQAHAHDAGAAIGGSVRSASARIDQPAAPVAVLACVAGRSTASARPAASTQVGSVRRHGLAGHAGGRRAVGARRRDRGPAVVAGGARPCLAAPAASATTRPIIATRGSSRRRPAAR